MSGFSMGGGFLHRLDTWPEYFEEVAKGVKTFEVRRNDRNFQTGDFVELVELKKNERRSDDNQPTGRKLLFRIGYVFQGGQFGLVRGFCAFSLLSVSMPRTVDRTFINERGRQIRIVIEGPASVSENLVTEIEARHLQAALREALDG